MTVEKDKKNICVPETRTALILRTVNWNRQSVLRKREEETTGRLRELCNYDSPLASRTHDVLDEADNICRIIADEAERRRFNHHESAGSSSSATHAAENAEVQTQQAIDEMLRKHFENTDLYACMAECTRKLFGSTGGDICVSMEPHMVTTASTLVDYKTNVQCLPKKVLQDLKNFLKFASLSLPALDGRSRTEAEAEEDLVGAVRQAFQANDELDYQQYLRWEGLWRKCRASGQPYAKHSIFLASVISTLLNYNWNPSLPVQANYLSLIPIKIAIVGAPYSGKTTLARKVAQEYRLCYVSVPDVYRFFADLGDNQENNSSQAFTDLLNELSSLVDVSDVRKVLEDGTCLNDELNLEVILLYMKHQEHTVRGFVLDGYPAGLKEAHAFRTRLDGFDTVDVLTSFERERSQLVDDPLDPGPSSLPHDLLDVIVHLDIDDELSLKRLRETEYRSEMAKGITVRPVDDSKLDDHKLVETHKKLLKLKKDCEGGLMEMYADMSKTFVQLPGHESPSSLLSALNCALTPHLQVRFEKITEEPEVDILAGLHESAETFQKYPDVSRNKESATSVKSEPPVMKIIHDATMAPDSDDAQNVSGLNLDCMGGPLQLETIGFNLQKVTQEGAIAAAIEELKSQRQESNVDISITSTSIISHSSNTEEVPVTGAAEINPQAVRLAFRKFVLNEDPNERPPTPPPVVPVEEPKPEKKGAHAKKDHGKTKVVDGAKSTKGDSPYSKKAAHSEKEDIDEIGLPRPIHLPRKADLTNPLVQEYVDLISAGDSQLTGHGPMDPYKFLGEDLHFEEGILDDIVEEKPKSLTDVSVAGRSEIIASSQDMEKYFGQKTNERAEILGLKSLDNEITMEQTYLEAAVGAHYVNGFPVLQLDGAKCLPDQAKNEQVLLTSLDLSFPEDQEAIVKPADLVVDHIIGDHAEVVGNSTENEASGTLSIAEPKVSEAMAPSPPSPTPALMPVDPAGPARRDRSALGKRPHTATPEHLSPAVHTQFNFSGLCQWLGDRWRSMEKDHFACASDIFHTVRNLQAVILQQVKECNQTYAELAISHRIHFTEILYKWQEGFNAVESHKRTRTQYKEVLHTRTTEFAKQLTDEINKKLNAEKGLNEDVMRNGWLDETISAIYNSFVALMQLELDTFVDALNILRDYISVVEFRLIGMQSAAVLTIPLIELLPLDDGRRTARSLTPPGSEGRKGKGATQEKEQEKEKNKPDQPQQPLTSFRPLTQEPVSPWFVSRKVLVQEVTARLDQSTPKKAPPAKTERKSQAAVETTPLTRKHSKVQASCPQTREDIEEFMLKDVLEKARDAVTKVQESEQEARRNRYNVKVPEEPSVVHPGTKKPGGAAGAKGAAAAAKGQPAPPVSADARPSITFSGHEKAINEETTYVLPRLEGIVAFGASIIAEIRKVAKTLDTKIVQTLEENYRKELSSATMLIEYIRSQIENEEPIQQALVYVSNRFVLSCDQLVRVEEPARQEPTPHRPTFYDEQKKLCSPDGKISYDDLQKAMILSVERSHGKDLVHKDWYNLDSDDLINAAQHLISPDINKMLPDGVNIADVQMDWDVALKALGNQPAADIGHRGWF